MRVLICAENIFSGIGGGQSFYADIIDHHTDSDFWYFADDPKAEQDVPPNAHPLKIRDLYRSLSGDVTLDGFEVGGFNLSHKNNDLLYVLDLASAASGMFFDVVDIPDYTGCGAAIPPALKMLGVSFRRLAVSLHGTLSMGITDNWADLLDGANLAHLRHLEDILMRSADIRYAISKRYLADREQAIGVPCELLNLSYLLPFAHFRSLREKTRSNANRGSEPFLPSVAFIGRQEKWKGPDLFIDIVAKLPRTSYASAKLVGPGVTLGGVSSSASLQDMATRRGLPVEHVIFRRQALWAKLAESRWIAVFPSRRDTLNLAALEALLSGTPAIISTGAGIVDFLDEVFPGIPFIKLDPDNLSPSHDHLVSLLGDFDAHRARLHTYLDTHAPRHSGKTLDAIYAAAGAEGGDDIYAAFNPVLHHLIASSEQLMRARERRRLRSSLEAIYSDQGDRGVAGELIDFLVHGFEQACELRRVESEVSEREARIGFLSDDQIEIFWEYLDPFCYGINRVPLYRLLSRIEKRRGNHLLGATYDTRCMRLGGIASSDMAGAIAATLVDSGFREEARVVDFLYGDVANQGRVHDYLLGMCDAFPAAPEGGIALQIDERTVERPRVSIIVSLYQAAGKLPLFFDGLCRLSERTRDVSEIVLVDSNSLDDTTDVVRALIANARSSGWNASILYVKSEQRETIQKAWNRGIEAASGEYLSFLGVDEMNHVDAFDIMADFLDAHPEIDWVQGTALVTEVNPDGSFVRDAMLYDRRFAHDFMNLFDTCYIGYVGALYRKAIHQRVGFYDERFRGAGDSEFKNRALPHMRAATLTPCLGFFLNYPEERTTQSPMAEIEDIRAWYLHRTAAGASYQFANARPGTAEAAFAACSDYRKTYMGPHLTDVELACSIADAAPSLGITDQKQAERAALIRTARGAYRVLDRVTDLATGQCGAHFIHSIAQIIERAAWTLADAERALDESGMPMRLAFRNDNRSHQHFNIWRSQSQRLTPGMGDPVAELAGPQDLAEVFSACQAMDQSVDFERAWAMHDLKQVFALQAEQEIDVALEWSVRDAVKPIEDALAEAALIGELSVAIVGARPSRERFGRMYFTGPVAMPGPVLIAARTIIVRGAATAPGIAAIRLLRAILSGRRVIADGASLAALARVVPDVDLSGIERVDDLADAFASAASPDCAMDPDKRAMLVSRLRQHPAFEQSGRNADAALLPETRSLLRWNREIRARYEEAGQPGLADLVVHSPQGERGLVACLVFALLDAKTAPILGTKQPIFAELSTQTITPALREVLGGAMS